MRARSGAGLAGVSLFPTPVLTFGGEIPSSNQLRGFRITIRMRANVVGRTPESAPLILCFLFGVPP